MRAKDFDRKFDSGENITKYLKLSSAKRHGQEQKRGEDDLEALRRSFRPETISTLLVGESPPANRTFFYRCNSNLFRFTREAFENVYGKTCSEGEGFLRFFSAHGFYLEDLCQTPLNGIKDRQGRQLMRQRAIPWLEKRLVEEQPKTIISVMRGISPHVAEAANLAGLAHEFYSTPFPSMGHQRQYVRELSAILTTLGIY